MRRTIAPLLAALLVTVAAPAFARAPGEVPLPVWKITAPNQGDEPDVDYVLGTMHVPLKGDEKMPEKVKSLIKKSSTFIMEADIDEKSAPLLLRYARQPAGQQLQKQLNPGAWKKLVGMKPAGLKPEQLNALKPWFVAMAFTWPARGNGLPIDQLLRKHAEQQGLAVDFLETAEQQAKMLDSISDLEDLKMLEDIVQNPQKALQESKALEKAYFDGDEAAIAEQVYKGDDDYPDFMKKALFQRNERWLPQVEELILDDDTFIAVGLAHLIGERGLLRMLEERDYKVEKIEL